MVLPAHDGIALEQCSANSIAQAIGGGKISGNGTTQNSLTAAESGGHRSALQEALMTSHSDGEWGSDQAAVVQYRIIAVGGGRSAAAWIARRQPNQAGCHARSRIAISSSALITIITGINRSTPPTLSGQRRSAFCSAKIQAVPCACSCR
jgi:hypothetical protein